MTTSKLNELIEELEQVENEPFFKILEVRMSDSFYEECLEEVNSLITLNESEREGKFTTISGYPIVVDFSLQEDYKIAVTVVVKGNPY